jgi:hypothetical protein
LYKIATESGTRAIFAPVDTHNSSRTHYMVLRAIHENSLYLSATTDIGRFDIDAPQTIAPQQIAPPAESPPEAATHDVPSAPEPIVSMRIFKPIPLVVEPMKWSTAPK